MERIQEGVKVRQFDSLIREEVLEKERIVSIFDTSDNASSVLEILTQKVSKSQLSYNEFYINQAQEFFFRIFVQEESLEDVLSLDHQHRETLEAKEIAGEILYKVANNYLED